MDYRYRIIISIAIICSCFVSTCYSVPKTTPTKTQKGAFQNYCQVPGVGGWKKVNWWLVLKESGGISDTVKYALAYNIDSNTPGNPPTTIFEESMSRHHKVGFKSFIETISFDECKNKNNKKYFQSWFHENPHAKLNKVLNSNFNKPIINSGFTRAHSKFLVSHDPNYDGFIVDHSLPMPHSEYTLKDTNTNPSQHAFCFNFNEQGFETIIKLFQVIRPNIVKRNGKEVDCQNSESPLWIHPKIQNTFAKPNLLLQPTPINDDCPKAVEKILSTLTGPQFFRSFMKQDYPKACYTKLDFPTVPTHIYPKNMRVYGFVPRSTKETHNCFSATKSHVYKNEEPEQKIFSWNLFYSPACKENEKEDLNDARTAGKKTNPYICSPLEYGLDSWLAVSKLENKLLYVSTQNQNHKLSSYIGRKDPNAQELWGVVDINSFFDSTNRHEKIGVESPGGGGANSDTVCIGDSNRVTGQLHHLGSIFCFEDTILASNLIKMIIPTTPKKTIKASFNTINLYSEIPLPAPTLPGIKIVDPPPDPKPKNKKPVIQAAPSSSSAALASDEEVGEEEDEEEIASIVENKSRYPSFFYPNAEIEDAVWNTLITIKSTNCRIRELDVLEKTDLANKAEALAKKRAKNKIPKTDQCVPLFHTLYYEKGLTKALKLYPWKASPQERWDWIKAFADINFPRVANAATTTEGFRWREPHSKNYFYYYIYELVQFHISWDQYKTGRVSHKGHYPQAMFSRLSKCWNGDKSPEKIQDWDEFLLKRLEDHMGSPIPLDYGPQCHHMELINLRYDKHVPDLDITNCKQDPPTCTELLDYPNVKKRGRDFNPKESPTDLKKMASTTSEKHSGATHPSPSIDPSTLSSSSDPTLASSSAPPSDPSHYIESSSLSTPNPCPPFVLPSNAMLVDSAPSSSSAPSS